MLQVSDRPTSSVRVTDSSLDLPLSLRYGDEDIACILFSVNNSVTFAGQLGIFVGILWLIGRQSPVHKLKPRYSRHFPQAPSAAFQSQSSPQATLRRSHNFVLLQYRGYTKIFSSVSRLTGVLRKLAQPGYHASVTSYQGLPIAQIFCLRSSNHCCKIRAAALRSIEPLFCDTEIPAAFINSSASTEVRRSSTYSRGSSKAWAMRLAYFCTCRAWAPNSPFRE